MALWSQFRMDASRHVSRGAGESAIAAAAYRSGEKLYDARTGEVLSSVIADVRRERRRLRVIES